MKKWKAPAGPTGGIPVCQRRNLWYNTLKPNRADPRRPCRRNHRKVIGMIEQVTIVGMGALGILYGDRLSRYLGADHVRFLAAGERLERYRREGAWCNGKKCAFQFSDGTDGEAQLLIFAVKAPGAGRGHCPGRPLCGGGDRRPVCAQRCDQRGDPQPGFWSGEGALCGGPGHGCRAGGQPAHLYPRGHPLSGGAGGGLF